MYKASKSKHQHIAAKEGQIFFKKTALHDKFFLCQGKVLWLFFLLVLMSTMASCRHLGNDKNGMSDLRNDIRWLDGTITPASEIPGKLLSDNPIFAGDSVETQLTYYYPHLPNVKDQPHEDNMSYRNRFLIDGRIAGHVPRYVVMEGKPLEVIFDLKQICKVNEVDIITDNKNGQASIEFSTSSDGPWSKVTEINFKARQYNTSVDYWSEAEENLFSRLKFPGILTRYLKLSVSTPPMTRLQEVFIFGDAKRIHRNIRGRPDSFINETALPVKHIDYVPKLDGKINEFELTQFKMSAKINRVGQELEKVMPDGLPPTKAGVAACPKGLYLVVHCDEPVMSKRKISNSQTASWNDDGINVFLNTYQRSDDMYFRAFVNSDGRQINGDSRFNDPTATGEPFHFRQAVHQGEKGWTVEMIFPLTSIAGEEMAFRKWKIFVVRNRNIQEIEGTRSYSWPKMSWYDTLEKPIFGVLDLELESRDDKDKVITLIPGMPESEMSANHFDNMVKEIRKIQPKLMNEEMSWFVLKNWSSAQGMVKIQPWQLNVQNISNPIELNMLRNEHEGIPIVLWNWQRNEKCVKIQLDSFRNQDRDIEERLKGSLYIAGAMWTKAYGNVLRPLFAMNNKLSPDRMDRYLTNGQEIANFPDVTFSSGGMAVVWLKVLTSNVPAGLYLSNIKVGDLSIPISVNVLPYDMPRPKIFVSGYSGPTISYPFAQVKRLENEIDYMISSGITNFRYSDKKNLDISPLLTLAEVEGLRKCENSIIRFSILPFLEANCDCKSFHDKKLVSAINTKNLQRVINNLLAHTQKAHLPYENWCVEFWDEPHAQSLENYLKLAEIVKNIDDKIQIYCNPYWNNQPLSDGGLGIYTDAELMDVLLNGKYSKLVDISVPWQGMANSYRYEKSSEILQHTRFHTFYTHSSNLDREIGWNAFRFGCNGFSYWLYSENGTYPAGKGWPYNPWDDCSSSYAFQSYCKVFPGPNGPIITFESEALRESYDDYCLLTLLKHLGKYEVIKNVLEPIDYSHAFIKGKMQFEHRREVMMTTLKNENHLVE